jgi:metallophosphoesterase superfamily enzyme
MSRKYSFLDPEIQDNFFIPDTRLAKSFIYKYNLKYKLKNIQDYIFYYKSQLSIVSILNSILQKKSFNDNFPTEIELSERYFKQLIKELKLDKNIKTINFKVKNINKSVKIIRTNNKTPIIYDPQINKQPEKENILIIGDLHTPFEHEKYLDFCIKMKHKYNTTKTIFIGDIIDNHYHSFHPTDPDGYSAGDELKRAKDRIKLWYKEFPNAIIIKGNHDILLQRRAYAHGLSKEWIKSLNEVLEVPKWNFTESYIFQNILFIHGTGMSGVNAAYNKALYEETSVVMGHQHTIANIIYVNQTKFAMIVGSGIDKNKYAFNYARFSKKPIILSCGIITTDNLPIIETMK